MGVEGKNRKNPIAGVGEEIVKVALAGSLNAGNFSPGWRCTNKQKKESGERLTPSSSKRPLQVGDAALPWEHTPFPGMPTYRREKLSAGQ